MSKFAKKVISMSLLGVGGMAIVNGYDENVVILIFVATRRSNVQILD